MELPRLVKGKTKNTLITPSVATITIAHELDFHITIHGTIGPPLHLILHTITHGSTITTGGRTILGLTIHLIDIIHGTGIIHIITIRHIIMDIIITIDQHSMVEDTMVRFVQVEEIAA